jgi:hypothetical protein
MPVSPQTTEIQLPHSTQALPERSEEQGAPVTVILPDVFRVPDPLCKEQGTFTRAFEVELWKTATRCHERGSGVWTENRRVVDRSRCSDFRIGDVRTKVAELIPR